MDHNTPGEIFQEITSEFSDMKPTELDELEDKVLRVMYRLGEYLLESKLSDRGDQLGQDTCQDCGGKLKHQRRSRQISTQAK